MASNGCTIPATSRGGAILTSYIAKTGGENPFWLVSDEILDIAYKNKDFESRNGSETRFDLR
jgi:thiamine biosynthesis protein ThiC